MPKLNKYYFIIIKSVFLISTLLITAFSFGQTLTQNIRGKVMDNESQVGLSGAKMVVMGTNPAIETISDSKGSFKLENVPIGRHIIQVTLSGYESVSIPELEVGSAKEVVLKVNMTENIFSLSLDQLLDIKIKVNQIKGDPKSPMAAVSARSFTVEETKRYPANFNDPSRMALSYAGVATTEDLSNEIVIRGNSPNGLLWRIEGVEVPNPNHYAEEGYTSGFISILSSNLVGKSDFFTSAFPAEYGNALSGVFDVSLRNGNNEKHEYSFLFDMLGTNISMEGPVSKNSKASYNVNYRYSTLSLFRKAGFNVTEDMAPDFQDLSFKIKLPTERVGQFSLWMLGGLGNVFETSETDSLKWSETGRWGYDSSTGMMASGLTHLYYLTDHSWLKSIVAFSGNYSYLSSHNISDELENVSQFIEDYKTSTLRFSSMYNNKVNSKFTLQTGITGSYQMYSYFNEERDSLDALTWVQYIDDEGNTRRFHSFVQTKYRLSKKVSLNTGIHYSYFHINKENSFEPRVGLTWKPSSLQTLAAGFGIHSRLEQLSTYFLQVKLPDDSYYEMNRNLELTKAAHYVLSYDNKITKNLHMNLEVYYQDIFSLPVSTNPESTFSPFNGDRTLDTLECRGKGKNYGVELTIEKFFTNNFYYLITGSLFDSKYKTADGNWYNTTYSYGHITNFIFGKEFWTGKEKNNIFGVNTRFIWMGGTREWPKRLTEYNYGVRELKTRNELQHKDYLRMDLKLDYRINRVKTAHTISLDIQNLTNRMNVFGEYYDIQTNKMFTRYQTGIFPNIIYRLEF